MQETRHGEWFLETEGRRVELRDGDLTLGRSRTCEVMLRDPSVSRGHALLSVRGSQVTLQDLKSSNGTYVNGRLLEAETPLADGDRFVIGETEIFLRRMDGPPGPAELWEPRETAEATPPAGFASLFCVTCGRELPGDSRQCPSCGSQRTGMRSMRPAEALGAGEVLPVGEMLAAAAESWEETRFRPGKALAALSESVEASRSNLLPFDKRTTAEVQIRDGGPAPQPPVRAAEGFWRRLSRAWRVLRGRA